MAHVSIDPKILQRQTFPEASAVAKSDTVDLANTAFGGLYVSATGNVKFNDLQGNTVTLTAVAANVRIPIGASRVWNTGTTATVLALN